MGQCRVVERADGLGDPDRLGVHLDDQRLAHAPGHLVAVRGRHADARGGHPEQVLLAAGEGHDGVQRERERTEFGGGFEDLHALRAAGVHDDLARAQRLRGDESLDQAFQLVVRHGQQHQVGACGDLGGVGDRDAGQQFARAVAGGLGDGGNAGHHVARPGQRGAQHGSDAACRNDTDGEPRRTWGRVHATNSF